VFQQPAVLIDDSGVQFFQTPFPGMRYPSPFFRDPQFLKYPVHPLNANFQYVTKQEYPQQEVKLSQQEIKSKNINAEIKMTPI
jgi:hypothetical protein